MFNQHALKFIYGHNIALYPARSTSNNTIIFRDVLLTTI